ncbi:MAG: lysophospholipase [Actinobacteria bacterium]|nr:lysophospholipase [Actinomycetota bacterium]
MPEEREVETPSGVLVVHVWRPAGAATYTVLLAHGYAEHARRYDHVAERLSATGAVVVAPDQRGHGLSAGERGLMADLDAYAVDLDAVLTSLCDELGGLPLVLVGHSMGGLIAARFAQRWAADLTALVLSGPVLGGNPAVFALADSEVIPDDPVDPDVLSRDPAVGLAFVADPLVYHGPYRRETIEAYRAAVNRLREEGPLGDQPTLWMHGSDDALAPLDLTAEAFERVRGVNSEVIVYPEARHEIFNETNRERVLDDLVSFVVRSTRPDEQ